MRFLTVNEYFELIKYNIPIASLRPIQVKIADFGVSKHEQGTEMRTQCGTPGYVAPELLRLLSRTEKSYTNAVDMWALGCVVHEILTSRIPFLGPTCVLDDPCSGLAEAASATSLPQLHVDMNVLYKFCSGEIKFPIENLQQSKASSYAIEFVEPVNCKP